MNPTKAPKNHFSVLDNLTIGQKLSKEIKSLSYDSLTHDNKPLTIYLFKSDETSHPHIIYVDNSEVITFIQLTIADSALDRYSHVSPLDSEAVVREKVPTEIFIAYPEKGRAYI